MISVNAQKLQELREKIFILHLDRRVLAARLKISSRTLNCKLIGSTAFSTEQLAKLNEILEAADEIQRDLRESACDTGGKVYFGGN